MKILSADQIRRADAATIAEEGIHSDALMERASAACTNFILRNISIPGKIYIFCGTGNNGGDGLCIARLLCDKGYQTVTMIVGDPEIGTSDFKTNYKRLQKRDNSNIIRFDHQTIIEFAPGDLVIDAVFGTGLSRIAEAIFLSAIQMINSSGLFTISIDMPSGLFADEISTGEIVKADMTLTFQSPKLSFFFPEHHLYTGYWHLIDLKLSKRFISEIKSTFIFPDHSEIRSRLHSREKYDHKGTYGHSLIIAGKPGMTGAAELCAYACIVSGSGLVTVSTGTAGAEFPELMTAGREEIMNQIRDKKYSAIGIGPGLGTESKKLLQNVIELSATPLVIDADGLNILSQNKELLDTLPKYSILTPHPKEFARLFGEYENEKKRIEAQQRISVEKQIIIIYKRANTVITTPDGIVYFNSTGNPGMATGGSGDILTGMITALLAQKYDANDAAIIGVFLHGLAADLAISDYGGQSLVAEDIIDFIPSAFEMMLH